MFDLAGPAIPVRPKRTLRTDLTLRIIDTLFVWTTQNTICHYDGFHPVLLHENLNVMRDGQVGAEVPVL